MQPVLDFEQFSTLLQSSRGSGGGRITNLYVPPQEMKRTIAAQRMLAHPLADGILFFRITPQDYRLYYDLQEESVPMVPEFDRPIVLEIPAREANASDALERQMLFWKTAGFVLNKTYHRMTWAFASSTDRSELASICNEAFQPRLAGGGIIPEILSLWVDALERFMPDLPSLEDLHVMAGNGQCYCICDRQGAPVAALCVARGGRVCTLSHAAVSPRFLREGLATRLLAFALGREMQGGMHHFRLWVAEDNGAVGKLCERFGFLRDGLTSIQLVRV